MEKILLIINSQQVDANAINFALYVASSTQSKLTGVVVQDLKFQLIPEISHAIEYQPAYFESVTSQPITKRQVVKMDVDQSVHYFKTACQKKGVPCEVYLDKGSALEEVVFESRFADLLIIDPGTTFELSTDGQPTRFVKEVLAKAECPVVIAPDFFEGIDEVIFCYDDSRSSAFAIKQATYLLPQLINRKITMLEIGGMEDITNNESHFKMLSWLKAHYPSVNFHALKGSVQDELFTYLLTKHNVLVVMGAFGRSALSNFFRKSSADVVLRVVDLPLFITHH